MNDYNSLHNSTESARDYHATQVSTHKNISKYYVLIGYLRYFVNAIVCNLTQSKYEYLTHSAIAVLGENKGKTKKAADAARDRSLLSLSQGVSRFKRDVITFPKNFRFQNPVFKNGESVSWTSLTLNYFSQQLQCRIAISIARLDRIRSLDVCIRIASELGFK
jgi:hypothetical protein